MDQPKTINILAGVIILIVFLSIATQPFMIKRKEISRCVDAAEKALNYWKSGDSATGQRLWEDPAKFPSIYDLESYKITEKKVQRKGKTSYVRVFAVIDFAPSSLMPSGKLWVFEVRQKDSLIVDFHLADAS